jgi:CBS domain containing-hemolysin-like protein
MGGSAHGMVVSREEISAMADIGHQEGVFAESEMRIIKNLIAFQNIRVKDIMTPRTVVVMADSQLSLKEIYHDKRFLRFSRIPVFSQNRDNITGYLHKHELLERLADDQHDLKVKEIVREMLIIPYELSVPKAFERLMEKREHIGVAIDEYGGMVGVVTIEDVLETLLGIEIVDEYDNTRDMQEYARQKWRERARDLGILPEEEQSPAPENSIGKNEPGTENKNNQKPS